MTSIPKTPIIKEQDRTPVITTLLEIVDVLKEQLQALKDEVARLKGINPKPKIKPSNLEKNTDPDKAGDDNKDVDGSDVKKRAGSAKRSKSIDIHEEVVLKVENVPDGSRRKGYESSAIQNILI
jgi:hypothetical protein